MTHTPTENRAAMMNIVFARPSLSRMAPPARWPMPEPMFTKPMANAAVTASAPREIGNSLPMPVSPCQSPEQEQEQVEHPEDGVAPRLGRGGLTRLDVGDVRATAGTRHDGGKLFGLGGARNANREGADRHEHREDDAHTHEDLLPATKLRVHVRDYWAEEEAAKSAAHEADALRKPRLVGEPGGNGRHDDVVDEADAHARDNAVREVDEHQARGAARKRGAHEVRKQKRDCHEKDELHVVIAQ